MLSFISNIYSYVFSVKEDVDASTTGKHTGTCTGIHTGIHTGIPVRAKDEYLNSQKCKNKDMSIKEKDIIVPIRAFA